MELFVAFKRQPFLIEMNSFCLSAAGEICPSPLSAEPQQALFESLTHPSSSPPLPNHSLWRVLIFDNKPRSNLSCGPTSSTLHVCSLGLEWRWWKCRGVMGENTRLTASVDSYSQRERCLQVKGFFLFVVGLGCRNLTCLIVSQSLTRRVITEQR